MCWGSEMANFGVFLLAYGVAGLAALLGLGMGVTALFNPSWAGRLVRLQPDPDKREGRAELRANYGGLFTGLHAGCALLVGVGCFGLVTPWAHDHDSPMLAGMLVLVPLAALMPVGLGWLVLGLVRLGFSRVDGAVTRYNIAGAGFELVMGLALLAPCGCAVVFGTRSLV